LGHGSFLALLFLALLFGTGATNSRSTTAADNGHADAVPLFAK
jgi:hypothetical protein